MSSPSPRATSPRRTEPKSPRHANDGDAPREPRSPRKRGQSTNPESRPHSPRKRSTTSDGVRSPRIKKNDDKDPPTSPHKNKEGTDPISPRSHERKHSHGHTHSHTHHIDSHHDGELSPRSRRHHNDEKGDTMPEIELRRGNGPSSDRELSPSASIVKSPRVKNIKSAPTSPRYFSFLFYSILFAPIPNKFRGNRIERKESITKYSIDKEVVPTLAIPGTLFIHSLHCIALYCNIILYLIVTYE